MKNAFTNIIDSGEKWDEYTQCQTDKLLAKLNNYTFIENTFPQAGKVSQENKYPRIF